MIMAQALLSLRNGDSVPLKDVPNVTTIEFRDTILTSVKEGGRLAALFGQPLGRDMIRLFGVIGYGNDGTFCLASIDVKDSYPSLTPDCPQAHWFEREIAEQWSVHPENHPWLKPIRFHPSYRSNQGSNGVPALPGATRFFAVRGAEVHEVAVGPVHAGVIEPGHFRFQCHGEQVLHLEISLGYQHRGVERALIGGPSKRTIHYMETSAGDTSVGHATAYCEIMESLSRTTVPARAQALRAVALELERMANHIGDLGALSGDVGFLPTAAYCGRIRGDFLNMTALLCGSRFGRGMLRPGGVGFDADETLLTRMDESLEKALRDAKVAVELLWNTPSVMARLEGTGVLSPEICEQLGLVGPAARACGVERDVRFEFPSGLFRFKHIPISLWNTGDVFARAYVRWLEIQRSAAFVQEQIKTLLDGPVRVNLGDLLPNALSIALVEGWRGEICHVAITDEQGHFSHYKIVDTSFHNWMGLSMALRDQQISDFPLCNKSFNLSYCGHDL